MKRKKQKFVLFFEENDDSRIIDSKLVRLYTNRFTIDEDDQCEIDGIYHLDGKWSSKLQDDLIMIIGAAKKSIVNDQEMSDIHIVIGSHFGITWGWKVQ